MTEIIESVFDRPKNDKLSVEHLAEALYEGSPHLEFLMHKLARQYGDAQAILPPWIAQNDNCRDFWRSVAVLIIKYGIEGKYNKIKEEN